MTTKEDEENPASLSQGIEIARKFTTRQEVNFTNKMDNELMLTSKETLIQLFPSILQHIIIVLGMGQLSVHGGQWHWEFLENP